ncbi:MAG: beta propeller repeat protein [Planctomycetota bacterium]
MHKLLVHPAAPSVLFQQNHIGVYKSTNHGDDWERIDAGLPYDFGFGLALHAQDPHSCFVVPLEPVDYSFRATDGEMAVYQYGRSGKWRKRTKGLPRRHAHISVLRQAMANDTLDPCGVYVGTQSGTVFASADGGASWAAAAEHLPTIYSVTAAVVE